jgi:hypothetical protein
MSEEVEKLRATLEELKTELSGMEQDDPEVRELLQSALGDIQQSLEGKEPGGEHSIADRLASAARHYEDTHPNLSATLGGLIDALSRMGI